VGVANTPASLLLSFAEHDSRICFAVRISDLGVIYLNPAFENFFQMKQEDARLEPLLEMVHPDDINFLKSTFAQLQPGEFKNDVEFRMILDAEEEHTFKLIAYLQGDKNSEGILMGYLEDVTLLRAHERKLDDLSNKKNAILNILSHDLAGPLGAIQNYTYLLSKRMNDTGDEQVKKMISGIEHIAKRSTNMIQQFVRNEFLESSGVDVFKNRVDLVEKISFFFNDYYGVQDTVNKNFEFGSSVPKIFVEIDETKFIQVINNLISNALKFTPDGGTISVYLEEREKTVLIKVSDTGIGIPKKDHPFIFDKFSKARRPGLRGEPTVGLGMSIVKTIVEWHHGKIWFDSEEQKGTTFYIEIPTVE
jgi:two-component system sensor histidine kinase VicK